jgi:hypothetical protein
VVRDTPVADDSKPGINTTLGVASRYPTAVLLFLLALSRFNFKRTLWRCGQLSPYVRMGSYCTSLHRDCNGMGDIAKISPCIPSTCAPNEIPSLLNIHIIPSCQIYVGINNPSLFPSVSCLTTSRYRWNYVCAANDVSHAENWQSDGCW